MLNDLIMLTKMIDNVRESFDFIDKVCENPAALKQLIEMHHTAAEATLKKFGEPLEGAASMLEYLEHRLAGIENGKA